MPVQRKKIYYPVLLALGAVLPSVAAAQGVEQQLASVDRASSESASALTTVLVTAQKREESVQEVPTPITVLGGDDLLKSGIGRTAAEVLTYVPNASAGLQLHGRPRWWIRGVGTGVQTLDTPNPVGIYFDDVYISNASATGFPLFDLERVEVLRGPQGTLWGKNTTGGAINFISRRPTFDNEGYLKLDYGTYNDRLVEGAFGGALIDDRLAARGSIHYEKRDGRFRDDYTGGEGGAFEDGAFRFQLLGHLTDDLDALLSLHYRKYKTDGATSTVTGTGIGGAYRNGYIPSDSINHVASNADSDSDTKQKGILLNLQWQLGPLTLTSITAYEDYDAKAGSDGDNTPLEITRGWKDESSKQWSQELRLTSPREDRWSWVAGLHYFHENIDSYSATARLPDVPVVVAGANSFSDTDFTHTTDSYAIFGSTTFNVTDAFAVTAGLRWTTEKKDLDWLRRATLAANPPSAANFPDLNHWWNFNGTVPTNAVLDRNKRWGDWTYDLTPQYRITDHLRVYGRYAKGFRSGGFNTSATAQAAISQIVDPEYLTSYEIGVKSEWFQGRLNANANVFRYIYEDIQVNVVGPLPTSQGASVSYLQNVKQGRANGAEFDLEILPIDDLHINASLGILNTKYTDFDVPGPSGGSTNYNGNRFVRSPHYSAVLGFEYTLPLATGGRVVAGGDWKYQSRQYYFTTNQNDPLLGSGGYTLGNVRLSYITANDRFTFTGYVNNVGDKAYRNHALPGTQGATGDTTIWGEPRTTGVSVTARY